MTEPVDDISATTGADGWEPIGGPEAAVRLLYRFSEAVDNRRPSAVSDQFTSDGVFLAGTVELRGREAIEAFYVSRLADPRRRTRHVWSNVESLTVGPAEVRIRAVLTNYAFEPQVSESCLQMRLGNVDLCCTADATGRWRFKEHTYERVYTAQLPLDGA
jgi:hypothetical protein